MKGEPFMSDTSQSNVAPSLMPFLVCAADKYFSSFPKVGIVIPNPAIWLLPEFQDLAATLSTTLSLPNLLPHGAYVTPTSDGFLLNLPSCERPHCFLIL
jgi:hypothetical protein